jgi:outer membrane biosynthesis protein TonB
MKSKLGWMAVVALSTACGGTPPPAATPSDTPETPAPAASAEPAPAAEPVKEAPPEQKAAPEEEMAAEKAPAPKEREVKYVVTGGKLEVRVDGVSFKPTAKAIRVGGGWGVRLSVEGTSDDEQMHSLLQPNNGPLAFAGKVTRKGKTEKLDADERSGDDEAMIAPGTPLELKREWPGKSKAKPLTKGDKLELEVGLWGLGPDASHRRPLKRLLVLTMVVDKGEPRPFVAPPE